MKSIPRPGTSARGSTTGRPIMALLDLLGRRWAMRILWELGQQPRSFRDLQACCDQVSSSVLNARLGEMREVGLIEPGEGGYVLTGMGQELLRCIAPLRGWADKWAQALEQQSGG
ncbi:helix-turn-helix domain-containing protein [Pelomonas sp. SE-A7]|uniref:winged helix-turn-helix transcriptional regulator n=1 Tax=Pelomonas sp. SE-A7 TaxID=3054953 RepID=UPI00259C9FAD|nr:helix-turn-helix domain-containing protein [Pelomonas sp. SE-A7]MDM4764754.1 helix-turn-helix domain-containing protein [Pelomonas sp. SE-A7]